MRALVSWIGSGTQINIAVADGTREEHRRQLVIDGGVLVVGTEPTFTLALRAQSRLSTAY